MQVNIAPQCYSYRLSRNDQVTEISNITEATLQACNNEHMAYQEECIAPHQRWHVVAHNTCRLHAQNKITQKDIKMTNEQILLTYSRQHHIALLQR